MNWTAQHDDVRVSVVIALYGNVELTRRCLDALALSWNDADELILIDNASPDATSELLDELEGRCVIVRNDTNRNFAGANNQGIELARGRWICCLNNDTEPVPGWLDRMVEEAEASSADIVGARLLYPDGSIQHAGVAVEEGVFPRHVYIRQRGDLPAAQQSYDCQVVTGACMLIDADLARRLDGFDEVFRNGCEDIDLCLRAGQAGARVRYCGSAVAVHHESMSRGRHEHDDDNAMTLFERWRGRIRSDATCGDEIIEAGGSSTLWLNDDVTNVTTSIIVPLYGNVELTRACVQSVLAAKLPTHAELVLVDNASPDATREYLRSLAGTSQVRCVLLDHNENFAGGCNTGAAWARGTRLVFLNNDTEVQPGWLEPLERQLAQPGTGAVGCRLLYPDGALQHAGVAFDEHGIGYHVLAGCAGDDPRVMYPREVQAVTAACIAVNREAFDAVGRYDVAYRNGCEDLDLCLKIREHGQRIVYEPASVVVHHESRSDGRFDHARSNLERFLRRWRNTVFVDGGTWEQDPPARRNGDAAHLRLELCSGTQSSIGVRINSALTYRNADLLAAPLQPVDLDVASVDRLRDVGAALPLNEVAVTGVAGVPTLIAPWSIAERVGGVDLRLATDIEQLCDWIDRARLLGIIVRDDAGILPRPAPWYRPVTSGSLTRRWSAARRASAASELPAPQPFLISTPTDVDFDVELRREVMLLAIGRDDRDAFVPAMRSLLDSVDATDDTTILVRLLPDDAVCLDALEELAAEWPADAEMADIAIITAPHSNDDAIAKLATTIVATGVDHRLHRSLARHRGSLLRAA